MKWILRILMLFVDWIILWSFATMVMGGLALIHLPEAFQLVAGMASIVACLFYMNYRTYWRSTIN